MDVLPIKSYAVVVGFTDYPLLGDEDIAESAVKIREVDVVAFDGESRCTVLWGGKPFRLSLDWLYAEPGRQGEVPLLSPERLANLPEKID